MTHHSFYLKLKIGLVHRKYLNPDLSKQLHEAIFSKMCTNEDHPPIYFNNILVTHTAWKMSIFGVFVVRIFQNSGWIRRDREYLSVFSPNTGKYRPEKLRIRTHFTQCQTNVQKHIGLYLDEKCNTHKRSLLARFTGLGLLRNLSDKFPKQALVTIYKTFIRLHLFMVILCVISHIIKHLVTKLMVQLKDHLGRNSMLNLTLNKLKRWYRKFTCFHKIQSTGLPKY